MIAGGGCRLSAPRQGVLDTDTATWKGMLCKGCWCFDTPTHQRVCDMHADGEGKG